MARPADPTLRSRLIEAATAEFAAGGYAASTLDAIAARAGVTKGGVYFHFAGKEELFFAVLDYWRDHRRRELQVHGQAGDGAAAALRAFLAGYLAFHLREPAATHLPATTTSSANLEKKCAFWRRMVEQVSDGWCFWQLSPIIPMW